MLQCVVGILSGGAVALATAPFKLSRSAPLLLEGTRRCYAFGSHTSENDPKVLEKAKERALKGKTKSRIPDVAPGWEEVLASESEAIVKAEQRAGDKTFKAMQEETVVIVAEEMKVTEAEDVEVPTKQPR